MCRARGPGRFGAAPCRTMALRAMDGCDRPACVAVASAQPGQSFQHHRPASSAYQRFRGSPSWMALDRLAVGGRGDNFARAGHFGPDSLVVVATSVSACRFLGGMVALGAMQGGVRFAGSGGDLGVAASPEPMPSGARASATAGSVRLRLDIFRGGNAPNFPA